MFAAVGLDVLLVPVGDVVLVVGVVVFFLVVRVGPVLPLLTRQFWLLTDTLA